MRKLVVLSFITHDGVMQAPGGPEEDPTGGFDYGGWVAGYFDDFLGKVMVNQMGNPFDLLLGRKTYEIFASYWPKAVPENPIGAAFNRATKYVVSKTLENPSWSPAVVLGRDVVREIRALKASEGPDLQVHGSGKLVQTLLKNDLVDELWLKTFPLTLGSGKKLFAEGTIPAAFRLERSSISPRGVIIASYARDGDVRTGTIG